MEKNKFNVLDDGSLPEYTISEYMVLFLLVGAPGIFSDFLRSVQMLKRKQRGTTAPIKSLVKLQP